MTHCLRMLVLLVVIQLALIDDCSSKTTRITLRHSTHAASIDPRPQEVIDTGGFFVTRRRRSATKIEETKSEVDGSVSASKFNGDPDDRGADPCEPTSGDADGKCKTSKGSREARTKRSLGEQTSMLSRKDTWLVHYGAIVIIPAMTVFILINCACCYQFTFAGGFFTPLFRLFRLVVGKYFPGLRRGSYNRLLIEEPPEKTDKNIEMGNIYQENLDQMLGLEEEDDGRDVKKKGWVRGGGKRL